MKKGSLLFLALVLPALIFVFLKRFGRNEFSVPVFHRQAAEWEVPGCMQVKVPLRYPAGNNSAKIRVITTQPPDSLEHEVRLIAQNIDSTAYEIIAVNKDSVRCLYLLRDGDSEVVLDTAGWIRGYYRLASREETDRLILELKILLKHY